MQAKTSKPMPAARKPVPEKPWYMQTWAWIVAGLVILGLILFGFLGRRGKGGRKSAGPALRRAGGDDAHADHEGLVDDSEDEYALLEEIEQHPDELSLHLELASLYYAHRDQEKFEGAAEAMYTHVDDPEQPEWQQVRAMGEELCPDHPLFAELHSDGHGADESDSALAAMVEEDQHQHDDGKAAADDGHGYNFDFDLTPGSAGSRDAEDSVDHAPAETERHEDSADNADDEDLLSLSTLEPSRSSDESEAAEPVDEFDTDAILAEAESASPDASEESEPVASADDESEDEDLTQSSDDEEFSSNPVDTKLDLARAYQDMGDEEGARAMLEEVLQEGSDKQKDAARKLLDDLGNS